MDRSGIIITSTSSEQTFLLGLELGKALPPKSVVCLFGDLAAGKTTLVKGVVVGATGRSSLEVCSPTFVLLNIYEGTKPVFHFDLYRLQNGEEYFNMGFDEYWSQPGITCIEWSERIDSFLPEHAIKISLTHKKENERMIAIEGWNR